MVFPDDLYQHIHHSIETAVNANRIDQPSYTTTTTTQKHNNFLDSLNTQEPPAVNDAVDIKIDSIPTLSPALSVTAHLSLTATYCAIFALLFTFIYVQLWLIWWYRHRRLSYQTVFLFLCLIWAGLRTTLFSFYFRNCVLANSLPIVCYWLLYCLPVAIQFTTLMLLLMFFAQVAFKAKTKGAHHRYKKPLYTAGAISVILFLTTNIVCAVLVKMEERSARLSIPLYILTIRVSINDTLFLLCAIILSYCFIYIARMPHSHVVLDAKGVTVCHSVVLCTLVILLYSSRAVYNFISIYPKFKMLPTFGYDWVNVTDQADIIDLRKGYAFVSFGIVLFVWEVLPTTLVVLFFRVKKPSTPEKTLTDISNQSHSVKSYFFDNPRRYDSDDDLARPESRGYSIPGTNPTVNVVTPPYTPLRGHFSPGSHGSHYGTPRHVIPNTPLSLDSTRSEHFGQKSSRIRAQVMVHHSYQQHYYDGT